MRVVKTGEHQGSAGIDDHRCIRSSRAPHPVFAAGCRNDRLDDAVFDPDLVQAGNAEQTRVLDPQRTLRFSSDISSDIGRNRRQCSERREQRARKYESNRDSAQRGVKSTRLPCAVQEAAKMAKPKKNRSGAGGDGSAGRLVVRSATMADVAAITELNAIAYPTLAENDVIWEEHHVAAHMQVFHEGQFVVEDEGRVVAAASSLIVNLGRNPYRTHTWYGITDNGMFYNHDPFGDTLYGADVNVHPDYRGHGLGSLLYEARFDLCRRLNLRRIVLGGRLFDYADHAPRMSADEYARKVEAKELSDGVLSFQLHQGFSLKKVMANYLDDPRSLNYGTFLEWINPDHQAHLAKPRVARISAVQYQMRKISNFDGFARQVRYFVDIAAGYGSDFVLFPELLTAQWMSFIRVKTPREAIRRVTQYSDQVDELFTTLAAEYQVAIIGGTQPRAEGGRIENVASLYLADGTVHRQPKLHITPNEQRWWGIEGGSTLQVFDTPRGKVGILVCYDIEFPEAARHAWRTPAPRSSSCRSAPTIARRIYACATAGRRERSRTRSTSRWREPSAISRKSRTWICNMRSRSSSRRRTMRSHATGSSSKPAPTPRP